jgi:hypothetical protein
MRIFTERQFERRLDREREEMYREQELRETLQRMQRQIDELRWSVETKAETNCGVATCDGR